MELQPAYVLHSRPYRDTSLIVELFTRDAGRLGAVVRGGRSGKQRIRQQLQAFIPLLVSFQGRGGLKTLTAVETEAPGWRLQGKVLYSGFYINELLVRLLPEHDPHPDIYRVYGDFLAAVHADAAGLEPQLRHFEFALLAALGYAVPFGVEAQTGLPMEPEQCYRYVSEQGFVQLPAGNTAGQGCFSGALLAAIERREFDNDETRRAAKRLTRMALRPLLGNRPLQSRALFTGAAVVTGRYKTSH